MKKNTIFSISLLAFLVACVPARKFEELKSKHNAAIQENDRLLSQLQDVSGRLKEGEKRLEYLEILTEDLQQDTARMGRSLRHLQSQYNKMNKLNDELMGKYSSLQKGTKEENVRMLRELDNMRLELQRHEDELDVLEKELARRERELKSASEALVEREKRVEELQRILREKDAITAQLKQKVADALLGFKGQGLTVEQRNGKIYVSMEAKLLFPSGSTVIDAKGEDALVKLASVLQDQEDIEILVEGHTDVDKIHSAKIPRNNWELSVLRATAVVEIMLSNSNIDPKTLVPSGRSEYIPVDINDKAKNRRIEIILTPNLDELFEIINDTEG